MLPESSIRSRVILTGATLSPANREKIRCEAGSRPPHLWACCSRAAARRPRTGPDRQYPAMPPRPRPRRSNPPPGTRSRRSAPRPTRSPAQAEIANGFDAERLETRAEALRKEAKIVERHGEAQVQRGARSRARRCECPQGAVKLLGELLEQALGEPRRGARRSTPFRGAARGRANWPHAPRARALRARDGR
jgi:hypothetical protein